MRVVSRRGLRVRQGGEELPVRLQITSESVFHVNVLAQARPLLRGLNDRAGGDHRTPRGETREWFRRECLWTRGGQARMSFRRAATSSDETASRRRPAVMTPVTEAGSENSVPSSARSTTSPAVSSVTSPRGSPSELKT